MPTENGIGYSQYTQSKHDHYEMLLKIQIPIVGHILKSHSWAWNGYLHFDITAGNGGTQDDPGSPLIFKRVAEETGVNYHTVLIECNDKNVACLHEAFGTENNITVVHGDHCVMLPPLIQTPPIPKRHDKFYGSLFVDPTGSEPPWELLNQFSQAYKRIDLIIYLSATNIKRIRGSYGDGQLVHKLGEIDKKYWLVREHYGRHQWTFLIGTNWLNYPDWQPGGFYKIGSPAGQRVLRELNYTSEERQAMEQKHQLVLPFAEPPYRTYDEYLRHPIYRAVRQQAIDRSGGLCERCRQNPVTEVHHLEYPKWGTFEKNADDLQAICHDCHCEIHGKDD